MINSQVRTAAQNGFTLIELMIVIVIAAILLAIAVPSFQSLIKRNNVDSLQSRLGSALATARTEAASRNRLVTICASTNQTACSTNAADWAEGWIVFEDAGVLGDATDDVVIDVYDNSTDYTVAATPTTSTSISFGSQGFLATGSNATLLTICEPDKSQIYARGLFVNASGLVVKTKDTDGNGKHNNPTSTSADLSC